MTVQALGAATIEVAIGHQRTHTRQAQLTAVRVTTQYQINAVLLHGVENPQVRGVCDAQRHVNRCSRTGHERVVITLQVRVVHPTQFHAVAVDVGPHATLRQIEPAGAGESMAQVLPRQFLAMDAPAPVPAQVARRILGARAVVVITAENEGPWPTQLRLESVQECRQGLRAGPEVTGDNGEIRAQLAQCAQPRLLALLAWCEMHVRDVQDPHRPSAGRQHRHRQLPHAEGPYLIPRAVGQATERHQTKCGKGIHGHIQTRSRAEAIAGWQDCCMTTLKEQLQHDLTAAIRARDELASSTIRMALAAIMNEEVAGKTARTLTEAEELTVITREGKKRRESIEAFTAANRHDLADKEAAELKVLERYLPAQLSAEELQEFIDAALAEVKGAGAEGMKAMGAVMKLLQPQVAGRADGAAVAAAVRAALGA